jgi:hypothetical protein
MESCVKNDRYGPIDAEPMFVAQSQGKVFIFLPLCWRANGLCGLFYGVRKLAGTATALTSLGAAPASCVISTSRGSVWQSGNGVTE